MKEMKIIQKIFITSALLTSICFANTIHVPEDYPTIKSAVNYALNGDTILVNDGTYFENGISWSGKHILLKSRNGNDNCTIICENSEYTNEAMFYFGPLCSPDTTDIIDGFSLTGDNSIFVNATQNGTIKFQNCIFYDLNCKIISLGGWNYIAGGVYIKNSIFINNSEYIIECREESHAPVIIKNCLFLNNTGERLINLGHDNANLKCYISDCKFVNNKNTILEIFDNYSTSDLEINNCLLYLNGSTNYPVISFWSKGVLRVINSTFCANKSESIFISENSGSANCLINNCNFLCNERKIDNKNPNIFLKAENNWWGHSSGPYHPTYNPGGVGDTVNINVDVIPFLTSPDTVAPPPIIQNLLIDTIGVDFARLKWDSSPIGDLKGYRLYINGSPTVYSFSDTIDVGNDTICTLDNLITGKTYYVSVTCYDNSGDESWFVKTLPVMPSPVSIIDTELDQIDFGTVLIGDTSQVSLTVYNTGTADLNISIITTTSSEFISLDTTLTISPGNQEEIEIVYHPANFGVDTAKAIIFSDAYNDSEYTISLIGFGDLSPSPEISSIIDIPNDQGGNVRISFLRSKYDGIDSTCKIVSYTAWRLIEENDWDAVSMFNAVQDSFYYFVAPTLGDSTIHGIVWSTFKVSAHTENPAIFFYSDSLSGYSIDNIAPGVPEGLLTSTYNGNILLTWQPNSEKDFQYYGIYRSTCSNFDPDTMEIYTYATSDTFLYDSDIESNINYYYRVSAFDYSGNESEYSTEVSALVVGLQPNGENVPGEYSLSQNYPNPFNPTTTISYQLPKSSFVKLTIYDISGRLVDKLIDEKKNAGYYTVEWNAENVCSGVYFYRIEAGNFVAVKKGLLVK